MNPKCLDFLNQEIKPGSRIVYPGRQGSSLWMNQALVISVDQSDAGWALKVQCKGAAVRVVTCVERVVVIHPGRES